MKRERSEEASNRVKQKSKKQRTNEDSIIVIEDDDHEVKRETVRETQVNKRGDREFNPLPPSNTFGLNKTTLGSETEEKLTFWFEDLFQPPTVDPPARLATYLKRVFLTTYNVDIEWLFSKREPHRRITYANDIVLVHGSQTLQSEMGQIIKQNPSLPFSALFKEKKLKVHKPELKLDYGTHHGKLYLLYFENSLRVVITTSNLTKRDWKEKLQGTWVQEFPKKTGTSSVNSFERTLVDYLKRLQVPEEVSKVSEFDFSSASVTLVTSCPGYFSGNQLHSYGHMKVRKVLSKQKGMTQLPPTHCIFSSLGTLDDKFLNTELRSSLSVPQDLKSSSLVKKNKCEMAIIWPTAEFVKRSIAGVRGADHYCAQQKKFKAFLKSCLYKWEPERPRHLSHTKMYTQVNKDEKDQISFPWIYLTSSNLSKAAHGQLIHNEKTLMVRSFEIGVLFIPGKKEKFVPLQTKSSSSSTSDEQMIEFPIPYKLQLSAYSKTDEPWCDEMSFDSP